jgi:hypothetical protein
MHGFRFQDIFRIGSKLDFVQNEIERLGRIGTKPNDQER